MCNSANNEISHSLDSPALEGLRLELARQEENLLQALLMLQEAPNEVDAEQVAAQAESLATKRRRAIERCHPWLEEELGELGLRRHIQEYFRAYPSPLECAVEDGVRFGDWLFEKGIAKKPKSASAKKHQRIVLSVLQVGLSLRAIFLG